jgi:hypothetical protein
MCSEILRVPEVTLTKQRVYLIYKLDKIMKTILTHLLAFILGIIALPVIIYTTLQISPDTIPNLIQYTVSAMSSSERGIAALQKAETEEERFYQLGDAAKEAFSNGDYADAKAYAEELETLTPKCKGNWNYGNAIQDSNIVLGRIALKEGRVEDAKKYLLEAGKSPGSPQMDTFGPNMSLAKDLLEQGENKVVVEYFTLCKSFWEMSKGRLDEWIILVQAGRIPNFGANLCY